MRESKMLFTDFLANTYTTAKYRGYALLNILFLGDQLLYCEIFIT